MAKSRRSSPPLYRCGYPARGQNPSARDEVIHVHRGGQGHLLPGVGEVPDVGVVVVAAVPLADHGERLTTAERAEKNVTLTVMPGVQGCRAGCAPGLSGSVR
jgi:hypothetical protein